MLLGRLPKHPLHPSPAPAEPVAPRPALVDAVAAVRAAKAPPARAVRVARDFVTWFHPLRLLTQIHAAAPEAPLRPDATDAGSTDGCSRTGYVPDDTAQLSPPDQKTDP